ncbi:copine-3 isoform X1 [Ciona intestinalis]
MATGGVTACVTKVELSISCRDLIDKDVTSKSDPLCVIYLKDGTTKAWQEVARTERIQNSLNPDFSTKIEMSYFFEEVQQIRFSIYDIDNSTDSLLDDDFLGEAECSLGQIVSSKKYVASLLDRSKKHLSKSKITVLADEITDNRVATLQFKATKLDNKDFMGKSDPFLELWRENNGGWTLCHRTEVIKNNLNPTWKPFSVAVQTLCGGDLSRKIKIICHDWDSDGSHDLIGECFTTLSELQDNSNKEFFCINPKKKAKKSKYKNSGSIFIMSCKLERRFSFLDFIFGGLQLNFTVGIDFTGSNGDPTSRDSLHFMDPVRPNEYLQALSAVGAVVQDYDTDKLYPALGFGAKIPPSHVVSHEFPLNFRPDNPYCQGIDGIISAYQHALPIIKLWGPTNVSPIINHVARFAYNAQTNENSPTNYYILLILTDGAITDMDETRQAIVNASHLPMSIIIVGIGSADFSAMEMLDGDNGVLRSSSGQPVLRDIVQFVPYRDYKKVGHEASAAALAKAVLAEVPGQVTQYFRGRNLQPTQRK